MKGNNGKDAYWFSHDSNAKDDPKCVLLIDQLGLEGYGIYWVLVEILREQPDFSYPLALVPAIAKRYGTSAQKVVTVIKDFGLFGVRDDKFFYSQSLIARVLAYKEKQDKKSAAAIKANMARWEAERRKLPEIGVRTESERNPNGVRTESEFIPIKEKEIKEKDNISSSTKVSELCHPSANDDARVDLFPHETPNEDSPKKEDDGLSRKHCQQVVDFWNKTIKDYGADFPEVKVLSQKRVSKIRVRWKEFAKVGDPVDVCRTLFLKSCESKFMQGDSANGWKASFDWIFESERNWARIYEGNYDNKPSAIRGGGGQPSIDDLYREQAEKIRARFRNGTTEQQTDDSDFPEEQ